MALPGLTSKTLLFIFSFLFIQGNALLSNTPTSIYHFCVNGTEAFNIFGDNGLTATRSLLSDLASNSSTYSFFSSKSGSGRNASYGLFYCTANVDAEACQSCVETATSDAKLYCPFYKAAYFFYKGCTLRYSNSTVYATEDHSAAAWYYSSVPAAYAQFNSTLYSTLTQLIPQAAMSAKGFATDDAKLEGTSDKLYSLAQCTPDILGTRCETCLERALKYMPLCGDGECSNPQRDFILTLLPSCQLNYEVRSSSSSGAPPKVFTPSSSPGVASKNIWYVIVLALAVVAGAFALH